MVASADAIGLRTTTVADVVGSGTADGIEHGGRKCTDLASQIRKGRIPEQINTRIHALNVQIGVGVVAVCA